EGHPRRRSESRGPDRDDIATDRHGRRRLCHRGRERPGGSGAPCPAEPGRPHPDACGMTRFDATAIGEGGIRLSVPAGDRLERAASFDVNIAATEGNVLAGLSSLGWKASWVSALPRTPMARRVEHQFRAYGIDLSGVVHRDEGRLGTYYVEYGAAPRPTQVYF